MGCDKKTGNLDRTTRLQTRLQCVRMSPSHNSLTAISTNELADEFLAECLICNLIQRAPEIYNFWVIYFMIFGLLSQVYLWAFRSQCSMELKVIFQEKKKSTFFFMFQEIKFRFLRFQVHLS
jgi:hypothetical protein